MATSETLAYLYNDIKSHTARASVVYDKIRYVEEHGKLPEIKQVNNKADLSIYEIKDQIKRLNDLIYKTKKKLKPSAKPARAEKIAEWEIKLNQAEMEREKLYHQKKMLEHAGQE